MAGYSKESERQNKALKDLMSGKEHEKDYIQVGYEGKQENLGGKTRKSHLTDTMASVRMPWFCPSCKKAMKKKLDTKFWRIMGHCFDCQIEYENKIRVSGEGEYDKWARNKMLENKKAYLKDLKQSIDEFEKTEGKAEFFNQVGVNNPELEKEKWDMGKEQFDKQMNDAREYIQSLEEAIEDEQQEIAST
tara:strand:- start:714 stop:1283 length:570 start_codon:yes stop_codon:yes gene_type:complete